MSPVPPAMSRMCCGARGSGPLVRGLKPGLRVATKWSLEEWLAGVCISGREGGILLPDTMPTKGHEVVHAIVCLGDAGEHAGHTLALLGLGDGFEAEMGRPGGIGTRILGD